MHKNLCEPKCFQRTSCGVATDEVLPEKCSATWEEDGVVGDGIGNQEMPFRLRGFGKMCTIARVISSPPGSRNLLEAHVSKSSRILLEAHDYI
ncbi:hypothetical protein L6452_27903 [Arctium lappa]|uniref:Uncharacterized protein n=1 Tax=Arctium lappa TaxID=4217 RepID=A0ACB8ZX92_ARCLA|nr:hypothetical protein L6452_27903 [Arctium lappa]